MIYYFLQKTMVRLIHETYDSLYFKYPAIHETYDKCFLNSNRLVEFYTIHITTE